MEAGPKERYAFLRPRFHRPSRDLPMPQQRTTRQSVAIREAIESAGRPLSIEEILQEASTTVPGIGLRTVYRVVRRLQEENEILKKAAIYFAKESE